MLEVQNLRKMSQFTTRPIQWWIPTLDELSIWVELCTSRPTRQYAPAFESQVLFCFVLFCFSSVFGRQLDIHSGGIDLAFPHHENEVAQSEAYHQCQQWANYFLHSGRSLPWSSDFVCQIHFETHVFTDAVLSSTFLIIFTIFAIPL